MVQMISELPSQVMGFLKKPEATVSIYVFAALGALTLDAARSAPDPG